MVLPAKKKSKLGKKLLLLFCTIVVFLAVGEFLFRTFYPDNPDERWSQHHFKVDSLGFSELNNIMTPDPELFWRVKPLLTDHLVSGFVGTDTFLNFMVTTDENGLRNDRRTRSKTIIFLGDSCTFGIGVKARELYCAHTAETLDLGLRNLSCPGYTLFQGKRLLARLGWDPEPQALVVAFGFNDRLIWDSLSDPDQARVFDRRSSFLGKHSRFYYCARLAIEGSLGLLKKAKKRTSPRLPSKQFTAEARELADQAKARGIPVVFLFWPRIEFMDTPGMRHPYLDDLEAIMEEGKVAFLDLAETFRQNGGKTLFLDGIHATPKGHQLAAEQLTALLKNLGL